MWQLLFKPWKWGSFSLVDTRERPAQTRQEPRERPPVGPRYAAHWLQEKKPIEPTRQYAAHWLEEK